MKNINLIIDLFNTFDYNFCAQNIVALASEKGINLYRQDVNDVLDMLASNKVLMRVGWSNDGAQLYKA